jgi:hypothetical protein
MRAVDWRSVPVVVLVVSQRPPHTVITGYCSRNAI